MILQKIIEEVCPICGSYIVTETRKNKHTNGYWNESRTFNCGAMLKFSPNFMKTKMSEYHNCPNDPVEVKKLKKRESASKRLISFIQKMKIDKEFKEIMEKKVIYETKLLNKFR